MPVTSRKTTAPRMSVHAARVLAGERDHLHAKADLALRAINSGAINSSDVEGIKTARAAIADYLKS